MNTISNGIYRDDSKTSDPLLTKKHVEKHARFSVANVINSVTRENESNKVDLYHGMSYQEVLHL